MRLQVHALAAALAEAAEHDCRIAMLDWGVDSKVRGRAVHRETVARYLLGAVRDGGNVGEWASGEHLAGRHKHWCAALVGWAFATASAETGQPAPRWLLGTLTEMYPEAVAGLRGRWLPADDVRAGRAYPMPGSVAYLRRPSGGAGAGHVEFVVVAGPTHYLALGGNEVTSSGVHHLEWHPYSDPLLLGFDGADPMSADELEEAGALVAAHDDPWPCTGIDLSEFKTAAIDGPALESSHDFWVHRATSGARVDRLWANRVLLARGLRTPFGGYAWTDQRQPIGPQVETFLRALREAGCGPGWFRPIIDVEKPNSAPSFDAEWHRAATAILIDVLAAEYKCDPIIYGNRLELAQLGAGPWSRCPLWLAHYTTAPVTYPPPQWERVAIWQHAANTYPTVPGGRSPAYGGGQRDVDVNRARALLLIP